ncbi:lactoylglutathione lyase [Streptomyces sp. NPDC002825]|uniref:VOC family protein n=1 Tax=Streptomyces sp. NPDC002825 TaxID=3154666 RepID=UPI0033182FEC
MPTVPAAALPDRWFRTTPDSALLPGPRLLARSLIDISVLDERIRSYERLTGNPADLRMPIPDFGGLELAAVGNMLLIASARPFTDIQRRTAYSVIVPSLDGALSRLDQVGATVLEPPERILPGARARVCFPDGAIAELVEHRPNPGEQPRPPELRQSGHPGVRLLLRKAVSRSMFASLVHLYETALGVDRDTRLQTDAPDGIELATVGNLLVVGTDGPEFTRASDVRLALVTSAPRDIPGVRPLGPPAGHRLFQLEDGSVAEVWDSAPGFHDTPAAPARGTAGTDAA